MYSLWLAAAVALASPSAFEVGDCNLCHQVPDVAHASQTESCTTCHQWIKEVSKQPAKREVAMEAFPLWERYERNVASYLEVPSLPAAMARLEPEWVRGYLADPHDLRPGLPETMPRFGLDAAEIEAIVSQFAAAQQPVPATPPPDRAKVGTGRALFVSKGCVACHSFGGTVAQPGLPMAPDLAHTRRRMSDDRIVAWLLDPQSVSSAATMPNLGLSLDEATSLRDYLVLADPGWAPMPALGAEPVPTTAPVTWSQVEERVFGKICVHCHMNPENNDGRAGPGNAGGFGFEPTGIELETLDGVRAAAERIPDALLRRREEGLRDAVSQGMQPKDLTRPTKPGMPLGLPPLSDEDISLVLGWIAQGMPE